MSIHTHASVSARTPSEIDAARLLAILDRWPDSHHARRHATAVRAALDRIDGAGARHGADAIDAIARLRPTVDAATQWVRTTGDVDAWTRLRGVDARVRDLDDPLTCSRVLTALERRWTPTDAASLVADPANGIGPVADASGRMSYAATRERVERACEALVTAGLARRVGARYLRMKR